MTDRPDVNDLYRLGGPGAIQRMIQGATPMGPPPTPPQPVDLLPPRLSTHLSLAARTLKRRLAGEEVPLSTPWSGMERQIRFWPGMYVLVGGTGSGKTQWAMQWALHVAMQGGPVAYVGLEMTPLEIVTRLIGLICGCRWSSLVHGTDPDLDKRLAQASATLDALSFHLSFPDGDGWSYERLTTLAASMAARYPHTSPLIVVDYLQLVQGPAHVRMDMRERIRCAAICARDVVRTHGATVLLLSSTARHMYKELHDAAHKAEIAAVDGTPADPGDLVGVGKESGEVEYCADGQLVLLRCDKKPAVDQGGRVILVDDDVKERTRYWLALSKTRAHRPSWVPFTFDGGHFALRATGRPYEPATHTPMKPAAAGTLPFGD